MAKIDIEKIGYVVGILVAAGGLAQAIIGDRDKNDLEERIEALEKASKGE